MATYAYFSIADYSDAADYAATALETLGVFDSVEVTTEGYSSTITCKIDGTTVATFTLGGNSGKIDTIFGNYSNSTNSGMNYWIGYNSRGVFIDGYISGYEMFTYAVYKSKSGKPMFTYRGASGNAAGYVHVALDTAAPTLQSNIVTLSNYFSTLQGVCAAPGTETVVSVGDSVASFVNRQSNVPTNVLSVVSIDGTNYMTDGYLCIAD